MKKILLLIVFLFCQAIPQNELISVNHPVNDLIRTLYYKSVIHNFDQTILPLHRKEILKILVEAKKNNSRISTIEMEEINHWIEIFSTDGKNISSLIKEMNFDLYEHFKEKRENYFYSSMDSSASFRLSPVLSLDYLKDKEANAFLFMFGAAVLLDYEKFGFMVVTRNGLQSGERKTAARDLRVKQSYTFNVTGLPNFDATTGYFYYASDFFKLAAGRERILWGNSAINPLLLGSESQQFDFIKYQFKWKTLSYDFLHAWLVQPYNSIFVDSIIGDVRNKGSKYVAMNRISFSPWDNLRIGGNQVIIYANRNVELAYLTPFLFWESAQRSMGDLDNSFLVLDVSYLPTAGINIYSSFLMDDIHFSYLTKDGGNYRQNRWAYQIGFNVTNPVIFQNIVLSSEYSVIRPYTLSHPGIGEALSYTNNSYPLGINMEPNSTLWSTKITYSPFPNGKVSLQFNNYLHGKNIYDSSGKLIENVGGSYFLSTTQYDDSTAVLLDGELEVKNIIRLKFNYIISYLWNFEFNFENTTHNFRGKKIHDYFSSLSFRYYFFY